VRVLLKEGGEGFDMSDMFEGYAFFVVVVGDMLFDELFLFDDMLVALDMFFGVLCLLFDPLTLAREVVHEFGSRAFLR